ncbi:MAG: hypothetical protein QOH13_901, partial [Thermoleophilaceae bacterium]|nr:hypothetical protein [Thermoleophilaceae bacterium]
DAGHTRQVRHPHAHDNDSERLTGG